LIETTSIAGRGSVDRVLRGALDRASITAIDALYAASAFEV